MTDYADLRKRVESASGPDRELDALIAITVDCFFVEGLVNGEPAYCRREPNGGVTGPGQSPLQLVPAYTASLDAALGLVEAKLPGWGWSVTTKERWSWACVNEPSAKVEIVRGEAPTPALALLSALLAALSDPRP